jgi:hypothetical protein
MTGKMKKITIEEAKAICRMKGLEPGRVRNEEGLYFTRGDSKRLVVISWDEFEELLGERGLAVYYEKGFLRIMKEV